MSIDLAALKTEIQTDPLVLGYAGQEPGAQATLINAVGSASAAVSRSLITGRELLENLKFADWESIAMDADTPQHPAGNEGDYPGSGFSRATLFSIIVKAASSGDGLDWTDPQIRNSIKRCFPATHMVTSGSTTRDNIIALETIPDTVATRAEQLFGQGVVVSFTDITEALAS